MNKKEYISPEIQATTITTEIQLMAGSTSQNGLGNDVTNEEYNPSSGVKPSRMNNGLWDDID